MRSVAIYENPVMEPGVCGKCGSQQRDWFVDIGLNVTGGKRNPMNDREDEGSLYEHPDVYFDGALFICCVCINDMFNEINRRFLEFKKDHVVKVEFNGPRTDDLPVNDSDPISDGDDPDIEPATNEFSVGLHFSTESV